MYKSGMAGSVKRSSKFHRPLKLPEECIKRALGKVCQKEG